MSTQQIRSLSHWRRILAATYANMVMDTGPIAYWPLNEGSGTVARDLVNTAQNGTATGVTWAHDTTGPFGTPAPYFDGANDYVNIYSAALNSVFNGAEGTLAIWSRVANTGVWTDGVTRVLAKLLIDGNNYISIYTPAASNTITFRYDAGGTLNLVSVAPYSNISWFHVALTWSVSSGATGEVKVYLDAVQQGATQVGLGVWAGNLSNTGCIIGADSLAPANVWHGWEGNCAIWDRALEADQIMPLANP